MKISPLRLRSYFINRFSFESTEAEECNFDELTAQVETAVNEKNPLIRKVRFTLILPKSDGNSINFNVEVEGVFSISIKFPEDKRDELVSSNATAMLYSVIREKVSDFSARSKRGIIILPTVNFIDESKQSKPKEDLKEIEATIKAEPTVTKKKKALKKKITTAK